jgi:threonine dehydratase
MISSTGILREVISAESRIRPYIRETYLENSPILSEKAGASVYCKLENLQYTGAFKVRGALNKLLFLTEQEKKNGVVAASTGNHGAAVAYALKKINLPGIVFVPDNTPDYKVESITRLGAEVRFHGNDCVDSEIFARDFAHQNGMIYISPYNDPKIIGGQGTIGIELSRQLYQIDAVFIALGGGGLISGVSVYLKSKFPGIQIIGCSPENSKVMIQSLKAGRILDIPSFPTLSEGTAGGVERNAITFELCKDLVDDCLTVTEAEIKQSLRLFIDNHHMLIEGAAAVPIAAYLKIKEKFRAKNIVIIICGANISLDMLKKIL